MAKDPGEFRVKKAKAEEGSAQEILKNKTHHFQKHSLNYQREITLQEN